MNNPLHRTYHKRVVRRFLVLMGLTAVVLLFSGFCIQQAHAESNGRELADCMEQYLPIPADMSEGQYEDVTWDVYWSGVYDPNSPIDRCAASLGWAPIYPYYTNAQKQAALAGVRGGMV